MNLTELKKTLEKIKEELFCRTEGKGILFHLEKILKDILDGEYERRMKGWTLCWQIIMESFRDTACIVCTFSLENIMKVREERSRIISGGIERTQSGTELCWLPREKQQAALVCFYGEEDVSKLLKYVKHW